MTNRKSETPSTAGQAASTTGVPLVSLDSAVFNGVSVRLEARLGGVSMSVRELTELKAGEVLTLDAQLNDLIELSLNGALVGRGEIVAVGDAFGVRIVDIATT